jgi:hypothetical protein
MNDCLGITRSEKKLKDGISSVDYYISVSEKLIFDSDVSLYVGYSIRPRLLLARAILTVHLSAGKHAVRISARTIPNAALNLLFARFVIIRMGSTASPM